MLAPNGEDADQECQSGHDDLPWLRGAKFSVTSEDLPHSGSQHGRGEVAEVREVKRGQPGSHYLSLPA